MAKNLSQYAAKQLHTLASSHHQGRHDGVPRVMACPECNHVTPWIPRYHTSETIEGTAAGPDLTPLAVALEAEA